MGLVGNRFTQPRHEFPPWVRKEEQGNFFCTSGQQARTLIVQLCFGACCLSLSAAIVRMRLDWKLRSHEQSDALLILNT
eukprot:2912990-Amphidinium_carterae.1